MRIAITLDWNVYASSLMGIARNLFRELGKIMNEKKTFTITGIKTSSIGIGDINQHFDCVHIPNMGGYKFPDKRALSCKNLILGPSGIDEVIYGKEVYVNEILWKRNKPLIELDVSRWKKYIDKIPIVHVVANSELEEMHQYLGIPKEKMTVIHHGVNHDLFEPPNNKTELRHNILKKFQIPDGNYFIHVSESNYARKNIFRLFDAYKKAKALGLNHRLILVGKYLPPVKQKANEIPGIKLLGYVSDEHLSELIQGSDALILPSIHEGFGMPIVEAMSCGVPCIASNRHAPPEIVGDSGLLVDPYDVSDIANKMIELGKNKELLSNLSKQALERSKEFSWEKHAKQIIHLYEKITPQNKFNFKESYDLAAYRTLTTVCELFPDEKQSLVESLLRFNYTKMINWAIEYGLDDFKTRDFLLPFENWLNEHQKLNSE